MCRDSEQFRQKCVNNASMHNFIKNNALIMEFIFIYYDYNKTGM